jgi:hypothetical protein
MEVALITGSFILVAAYAVFEAWRHFLRIEEHKPINHIGAWTVRALVTCLILGLASFKLGYSAIPCAIGSAFLFSAVFRYCLNRMRGKDWRYISPSNWYDEFWIRVGLWNWNPHAALRSWHRRGYAYYMDDTKQVHRAGTIAYAFEVVILAVCIFIAA